MAIIQDIINGLKRVIQRENAIAITATPPYSDDPQAYATQIQLVEKAKKNVTGFRRYFRTNAQQRAVSNIFFNELEKLVTARDRLTNNKEVEYHQSSFKDWLKPINEYLATVDLFTEDYDMFAKIKEQQDKAITEMTEAFGKDYAKYIDLIVPEGVKKHIDQFNSAQKLLMDRIQNRRKKAEQAVARLSKLPYRWFSSSFEKTYVIHELILAQAAEHAAIETQRIHKMEIVGEVSTTTKAVQAAATLKMNLTLVQDAYTIDKLCTKSELASPEIQRLKAITTEAQEKYQEELEKEEPISEVLTPSEEIKQKLEAAQKEMNNFMRHFRSQATQQAAVDKVTRLQAELNAAYQEEGISPPEEHRTIEQALTQESANLFALGEAVKKAQEDVKSPKRYFRKEAEQQAAIERLKDAERRLKNAGNTETPKDEQGLLEAVIEAQEEMDKANTEMMKHPSSQKEQEFNSAKTKFEKRKKDLDEFREAQSPTTPSSASITHGLNKHHAEHAEARAAQKAETTSTPTTADDPTIKRGP